MINIIDLYDSYIQSNKSNHDFIQYLNSQDSISDINYQDNYQQTVLHIAVLAKDVESVRLLLAKKADISIKDKGQCTALNRCLNCPEVNVSLVRLLLQYGANINESDSRGFTALHWSVLAGNLIKTHKLLVLGADINRINHNLETPLRLALTRDIPYKSEMIILLFQKAVLVNQDFTGVTIPAGVTDNIIVAGSTIHDESMVKINDITRKTPGFKKAITNSDEFIAAINKNVTFDFQTIENITRSKNHPNIKSIHEAAVLFAKKQEGCHSATKHSLARGLADLLITPHSKLEKQMLDAKIHSMPKELQDLIQEEYNLMRGEQ